MARIIEGDQRRGLGLDLKVDRVPRLSPSMVPFPEFIVRKNYKSTRNSKGVGGRETRKTAGVAERSAPKFEHKLDIGAERRHWRTACERMQTKGVVSLKHAHHSLHGESAADSRNGTRLLEFA